MLSLGLLFIIGIADYFSGPEISTALFYLLPVAIAAWFGGVKLGFFYSLLAAAVWLLTDMLPDRFYSHPVIPYWNALTRLGIFLIISKILTAFHQKLKEEEKAAETDGLTGILNSRAFHEQLEAETIRSKRFHHPLSLAFIDLDNFKIVNDTYGHAIGDRLLQTIASTIKANTRKFDAVARLGGDEFTVLLVETDKSSAAKAIRNLQASLLLAMNVENNPVTFSIGLVTFEEIPDNTAQMVKMADDLMYEVKRTGKNNIHHRVVSNITSLP